MEHPCLTTTLASYRISRLLLFCAGNFWAPRLSAQDPFFPISFFSTFLWGCRPSSESCKRAEPHCCCVSGGQHSAHAQAWFSLPTLCGILGCPGVSLNSLESQLWAPLLSLKGSAKAHRAGLGGQDSGPSLPLCSAPRSLSVPCQHCHFHTENIQKRCDGGLC